MATAAARTTKIEDMFGAGAGAVDRMPMLRVCLGSVGTILFDQMKPVMKAPPRIALLQCQSMTAEDAFALHGPDCTIAVLSASHWNGQCFMTCDAQATFLILEMLLGSDPTEAPVQIERKVSKIERRISAVFFKTLLEGISQSFANTAETAFEVVKNWTEPDFDEVKPRSAMIVGRFQIESASRKGHIHFLVPDDTLAPVRQALATLPKTEDNVDPIWVDLVRKEFERSTVQLAAVLDERPGTLGEIASLRVGDILEINATADSQVFVETNGERLMYCSFGKANGVYTLRVEEFVNKEQELMDNILAT